MIARFSLFILLLVGSFSLSAARHCKTERSRTFAEQLAALGPKAELDLLDLDIFPGGALVAGYEYEVEPAYTKGLYSRSDSWYIGAKAIPKEVISPYDDLEIALSAGLKNETVGTFTRFFKDPCEAMRATPYSPKRIPLKARVALGPKFNIGDYFLFRGSVGFVASAEILSMLSSSVWGVGLSGSYLVEGFYQLHIVRLSENEIRLKVLAHRGKNISASLGLGYEGEFDVFSVRALDRPLEKFVNTKPLKIKVDSAKSNVFMVDYILDLTDEKVAEAFETILPKFKNFRNLDLAGPFRNRADVETSLLLDLSPLESLYQSDFANNRKDRIKRNLRTSSDQHTLGFGIHAGNKILGFKMDKDVSTAQMNVMQEENITERFLLKSWEKTWDGRFLYSWLRSEKEDGFRALFTGDKNFQKINPVNMVKFINHKKSRFSYKNFQELKKTLKKSLPAEIYQEIPFESWPQKRKDKFSNYGLRYQLIMAPESLMDAPALSPEEISTLFIDHIKSKGLKASDYFYPHSRSRDSQSRSPEKQFELSLKAMSRLLSEALNPALPTIERLEFIGKLRKNTLFSESGLSFIMVLRPDKMKHHYGLDLDISSNEAEIAYKFGDTEISSLYRKLLTIKAALDDDALDLLREAESISIK
jgi:hypothetical protein